MKTIGNLLTGFRDFVQAVRTAISNHERWSETFTRLLRRLTFRHDAPTTDQSTDTTHAVVYIEKQPSPSPTDPITTLIQQKTESYLSGRNLQIVEFQSAEGENRELCQRRHLARFMVEHCDVVLPLVQALRPTLQNGRLVTWCMDEDDPDALCVLTNVGSRMHQRFFLKHYQYHRSTLQLKMRVRNHPFAHNFISGQWFEMGVAELVRTWLRKQGYRHFLYQNLKLHCHRGAVVEIDLFLAVRVGDELRWLMLECKSGIAISADEANQVARASRLLNLFGNRCAVVVPERVEPSQGTVWAEKTGTSLVGIDQLGTFLCEALR
ncbi:MAG: hypothetical protein SNJ72_08710 [Fimbriimonadales bacterium]